MKFGVVVFPGSNCDHDSYHVLKHVLGQPTVYLWHKETSLHGVDVVVLPGGFSFGDYLRCGAIARFSPIMKRIQTHAREGGLVLGICNGFQILQEAGLLPGVMLRNNGLKFICKQVWLKTENNRTAFTSECPAGSVLKMPVAHHDGCFYLPPDKLKALRENGQIVLRYCDAGGAVAPSGNPNGSVDNIAAVVNHQGNVFGMMPHPERAAEHCLGSTDGLHIFRSMISQAIPEEAGLRL